MRVARFYLQDVVFVFRPNGRQYRDDLFLVLQGDKDGTVIIDNELGLELCCIVLP